MRTVGSHRAHRGAKQAPAAYLSGQEVATLLHVSRATVSRWARAGRLPCVRTLGGHRRYPAPTVIQIASDLGWPMQLPDVEELWE